MDSDTSNRVDRAQLLPFALDGMTGWIHNASGDVGVVICPGLGHEDAKIYRTMFKLGSNLSNSNFPVLRFNYRGTANSIDCASSMLNMGGMRNNLDVAIKWFKLEFQLREIVLIAFKLGTVFAISIAKTDSDISSVVLLNPVTSDRDYLRELALSQSLSSAALQNDFETFDHKISGAFLSDLQTMTAYDSDWLTEQTLLVTSSQKLSLSNFYDKIKNSGSNTTMVTFEDYSEVVRPFDAALLPRRTIELITDWIKVNHYSCDRPPNLTTTKNTISGDHFIESIVNFGVDFELRGIICEPLRKNYGSSRMMILCHGGIDPHFANGRLNVLLARALAKIGISSLRFDFRGRGDSEDLPNRAATYNYSTDHTDDLISAVEFLNQNGFEDLSIFGYCAAAYHAFRFSLLDKRISSICLLNMLVFSWRHEGPFDPAHAITQRSVSDYRCMVLQLAQWRKLLLRERRITRLLMHMRGILYNLMRRFNTVRRDTLILSNKGSVIQALQTLGGRGCTVNFLIGEQDKSPSEIELYFGKRGVEANNYQGVSIRHIPDVEHVISTAAAREAVVEAVLALYRQPTRGYSKA